MSEQLLCHSDVSSATTASRHNTGPGKKTPDSITIKMLEETSPCEKPSNSGRSSSSTATTPTKPSCSPLKADMSSTVTTPTKPSCSPLKADMSSTTTTPTKPSCSPLKADMSSTATTPTKPSCSPLKAGMSNSAPLRRSRSRRGPVRSLSTPLSRSFSFRCRSDRFPDRLTTYKNDFRSPEELSYKLHSLNLETSVGTLPDSSTTYRDSYRWPSWRRRQACPPGDNPTQPQEASAGGGSRDSQVGSPSALGGPRSSVSAADRNHFRNHSKVFEFCENVKNDQTNHPLVKYSVRRPHLLSNDPLWLTKTDQIPPGSRTTPSEDTVSPTSR